MTDKYEAYILRKLLIHRYIGGRHTNQDNIPKGLPRKDHNQIFQALDKLKREGFFWLHKKPDGIHISLNPKMAHEAVRRIEEYDDAVKRTGEYGNI